MNGYIDTHCHLNSELYENENVPIDELISQATTNEIISLVNVGTTIEDSKKVVETATVKKNIYAAIGVHPNYVLDNKISPNDIEILNELSKNKKVIAIGEIGLDYHYARSIEQRKNQLITFTKQIELSLDKKLPVIIHCRDAWSDLVNVLRKYKNKGIKGIVHCYSGDLSVAKELVQMGFYISFSGIITFKNAVEIREVVDWCPIQNLLIETDSPYLSPEPYRGKLNRPEYVVFVAKKIAEIKKITLDQLSLQLIDNVANILGI
ncbi:hypothetical protein ASO20_01595 [Mycoplasma sp. (ex Biomphalaria glabrata)]|uniref:TatD family hydrolase n=1 Tax=Mycoplasma sp. (ex Biomphalaria glabrata) TaxID=1749074 RepID=UPI00073AA803|nr:TatD family hydrolase [Mycoplasma sp. (ex Biomphalaria glabrata)]ALV23344.1 hypothetical protein ASO20_01595 [Mycoplasma sp. (ex Biomphalaria glabrata)]